MGQPSSGIVARILRWRGYVPAEPVRELEQSLARVEQHRAELKRALTDTRHELQRLRDRLTEQTERSRKESIERENAIKEKASRQIERFRSHDIARRSKLEQARERMLWAEKATQLGREHLMQIEVKLDLVESAINILDARTRTALAAAVDEPTEPSATSP